MSRFRMLSDAQWSLIEPMLPRPTGRPGRKFSDARTMVDFLETGRRVWEGERGEEAEAVGHLAF